MCCCPFHRLGSMTRLAILVMVGTTRGRVPRKLKNMRTLPMVRSPFLPWPPIVIAWSSDVRTDRLATFAKSMPAWDKSRRTPTCTSLIGSYEHRIGAEEFAHRGFDPQVGCKNYRGKRKKGQPDCRPEADLLGVKAEAADAELCAVCDCFHDGAVQVAATGIVRESSGHARINRWVYHEITAWGVGMETIPGLGRLAGALGQQWRGRNVS